MENGYETNFKVNTSLTGKKFRTIIPKDELGLLKENSRLKSEKEELKLDNTQLEQKTKLDRLTKVLTKEEFIKYLVDNKINNGAIMFIDVDDFKKVNDSYGHNIGDEVLKVVAKRLEKSFSGIVGRAGGDEFVAALPNLTDKEIALKRSEDFCKYMNDNPIVIFDKNIINQTVSIGTSINEGEMNIDDWMNSADILMYKAKRAGKNRVVMAE